MIYKDLDDQNLLYFLKHDDHQAFKEIYARFHDFLYRYAFRLTGDAQESQDIVQTLFMNLWVNRNSLKVSGKLFSYLHQGVRYGFLNQERSKNMFSQYQRDLLHYLKDESTNTEDILFEKELISRLKKLAAEMPGKTGKVFLLSYFENYSHAEIAAALDVSEKTVKNLRSKAVKDINLKIGLGLALFFLNTL